MAVYFAYNIPTKKHLKKFFSKQIGVDFDNAMWEVSNGSMYGRFFLILMDSKTTWYEKKTESYEDCDIPIKIPRSYCWGRRTDNLENPKKLAYFNIYLEEAFNHALFTYIDSRMVCNNRIEELVSNIISVAPTLIKRKENYKDIIADYFPNLNRKNSILEFMHIHGITDDDIKYDTLEKRHKRYMSQNGKKLKEYNGLFSSATVNGFNTRNRQICKTY